MNDKTNIKIFPDKMSVEEILKILEEQARRVDLSLEEAFIALVREKTGAKN